MSELPVEEQEILKMIIKNIDRTRKRSASIENKELKRFHCCANLNSVLGIFD